MINFDWERFKNGKIAVHCDTEEKANDFLKECDKKGIKWISGKETVNLNNWDDEREDTIYCCFNRNSKLEYAELSYIYRSGKKIKIIKWNLDNLEKTFREVIRDIKEGEVWECTREDARVKRIRLNGTIDDGTLVFDYGHMITEDRSAIRSTDKFKLQRKEYTFEEAFKAYEEFKEIEDYRGVKYKKIDGLDHYRLECETDFNTRSSEDDYWFSFDEIRGKWYIND